MSNTSYRNFEVWQVAIDLAVECYRLASALPREERFGLASQIRRAAVSVPANIAEGQARFSSREFARFVAISYGSLAELETHIELVRCLGYASEADLSSVDRLLGSVGRLLNGLAKSLKARPM